MISDRKTNITEEWQTTRYYGYAASNRGRVFSWKRGKYLKEKSCEEYTKIKIDGKWRFTHVVTLEAFHGPRPYGLDTLHLDGNPRNNVIENLRWGTRVENIRMSKRCKLKEADVKKILESRLTQKQIAAKFRMSQGHISQIKTRRCWKNVPYQTTLGLGKNIATP